MINWIFFSLGVLNPNSINDCLVCARKPDQKFASLANTTCSGGGMAVVCIATAKVAAAKCS